MPPYSSTSPYDAFGAMFGSAFLIFSIISLASIVFGIIVWWKIFSKAGYSGAMSLLFFVPIANLIVLCILAFGEWPIYQELNQLRQRVAMLDAQQRSQYPAQNQPYQQPQQGQQYPPQNPPYQQYR